MARKTAYSGGTLTIKLTESLTIDGRDYGGTSSLSFSGIKNVTRRIETITTTEATLLSFSSAIAAGTYIPANISYMRFANLDDTNYITLTFENTAGDEVAIKLDASKSFIWAADNSGGMVDMMDCNQSDLTFTDATCDYNNDPTIACDSSVKITPGLFVSGTGIPAGAYVSTVNTAGAVTSFELSASTTGGSVTNGTLTFTPGLDDMKTVRVIADTGSCDLEIYIAGTA